MRWLPFKSRQLQKHSFELLENIIGVVELADPNLEGHSLNVCNLVSMLYDMLPMRYKIKLNLNMLYYAALLLDLGKLGIPRKIIAKKGKLEKAERKIMNLHPQISFELLSRVKSYEQIAVWVKYHHERIDGKGFYHLKGNQIPLESRILAVADTFSAMMMSRNYKSSLTYIEAIEELKLVSGTQLDADIVRYFCNIPPKKIEHSLESVKAKMNSFVYKDENFK